MHTPAELFSYFNGRLVQNNLFIKSQNVSVMSDNPADEQILDENTMLMVICSVLDKYNGFTQTKLDHIENLSEINEIIKFAQNRAITKETALSKFKQIKPDISKRVEANNKEEIALYEDLVIYLIQLKRELGD